LLTDNDTRSSASPSTSPYHSMSTPIQQESNTNIAATPTPISTSIPIPLSPSSRTSVVASTHTLTSTAIKQSHDALTASIPPIKKPFYYRPAFAVLIILFLLLIIAISITVAILYPSAPHLDIQGFHPIDYHVDYSTTPMLLNMTFTLDVRVLNRNLVEATYDDSIIPIYINHYQAGKIYQAGGVSTRNSDSMIYLNGSIINLALPPLQFIADWAQSLLVETASLTYAHATIFSSPVTFTITSYCKEVLNITLNGLKVDNFHITSQRCDTKIY
jgi:hypothetical protein